MAAAAVSKATEASKILSPLKKALKLSRISNALISEQVAPANLSKLETQGSDPSARASSKSILRIVVKDNIATSLNATTCGSNFLGNYESPFEASLLKRLGRNGIQIVGKGNMDEFGMGSHSTHSNFGRVRNVEPYSDLSAGGSSGGSAVAVATGIADIALGTDTGGSVRLPAAYTGVVGFKPSYGLISRNGVVPYANSLDTVGILCRDCPTAHWALQQLQGHDTRDPTCANNESRARLHHGDHESMDASGASARSVKFRVGVPIEYNIEELETPIRHTWTRVLRELQGGGHEIIPVSLPSTRQALSAYYVLAAAEAASNLAKYDGVRYGKRNEDISGEEGVLYAYARGKGFGDEVKRRILLGSYTLSSEAISNYFIQAQKVRRLVQRDFDRVFATPNPLRPQEQFDLSEMDEEVTLESKLGPAQVDVLLCPTAPTLPPRLKDLDTQTPIDAYMNDVFNVPASLAGLPAVSVPITISEDFRESGNVPFAGIQVIGQYGCDELILQFGQILEGS